MKSRNKVFALILDLALLVAGIVVILLLTGNIKLPGREGAISKQMREEFYDTYNIVATDALGRTTTIVSQTNRDKYVGLFYFAWHNARAAQTKIYDVTKLLRETPEFLWDPTNHAVNQKHYFNEPLFGYYNSLDPWVTRKHIELFIAADIDFIVYDFTNREIYWEPLKMMLNLLNEYYEAGWKVPQFMFFTKHASETQIPQLYDYVYKGNLYPHLWFYGDSDKPYIIGMKDKLSEEILDFFNIRHPQWPHDEFRADGWLYVDFKRPQRLFTNLVSVSVAQHTAGAFSRSVFPYTGRLYENWGRGYTTDNPINGNIEAIERGDNFQEQWDSAIEIDSGIVFVTGWNEWHALKLVNPDNSTFRGFPYFVDTCNTEFSRDIEMTLARNYVPDGNGGFIQEGYGDNFYIQLINNVRKYKGIPLTEDNYIEPVSTTIDVSGDVSQWDTVSNVYKNISTAKPARDFRGFVAGTRYTQAAPDNFIREVRVTHDADNIYFYIQTEKNITAHRAGKTNWMNVFIEVDGRQGLSWENYHYVIN